MCNNENEFDVLAEFHEALRRNHPYLGEYDADKEAAMMLVIMEQIQHSEEDHE